jgi:putative sigma-54 modulation protein
MNVQFTARHFKPHDGIRTYAIDATKRLERVFEGIIDGAVTLSYEKARNSTKIVEVQIKVHGTVLTAEERSEDFIKSIDGALQKIERQLHRYKEKLRSRKMPAKGSERSVGNEI